MQQLTKVWSFLVFVFVILRVLEPYRRTDLSLVLKIRILFCTDSALVRQIARRMVKALLMRLRISLSAPPSLLTILPRHVKWSLSMVAPLAGLARLLFSCLLPIHNNIGFLLFDPQ
jgi:hypothetical protein